MAAILKELPADDGWDESIGIERGYKKAGLKRFQVQVLKGLKTTTVEDKSTEEVVKTKQATFQPETKSGSSDFECCQR